jgi:hypothetical protein
MAERNYYLDTIDRMEPDIAAIDATAGWASIAISLKRIADALDRVSTPEGVTKLITDLRPVFEAMEKGDEPPCAAYSTGQVLNGDCEPNHG